MAFDVFTLSALVDEFESILIGGRVQDLIDVDALGLGLEIYNAHKRHYLYLSADPAHPRVHLVDSKLRRGLQTPTQLGLLGRRYVEGAVVTRVSQPPWERLLQIDLAGPEGEVQLIAELMPRRANVLLLSNGIILDCLNRVGPDDNRYRLSLPNHAYVPPPPILNQVDPGTLTVQALTDMLQSAEKPSTQTRRLLPGNILGIGPLLAKEIVFRATGAVQATVTDTDAAALYASLRELLDPLLDRRWNPGLGRLDGIATDFSVFPLGHLDWQACASISAAITSYFGSIAGAEAYTEAKKPVEAAIQEARSKLSAKLASLQAGLRDQSQLEQLKQSGELILSYQYTLADGQTELRAHYDIDAPELVIVLNPQRSPLENAQAYFRKYEKAKSAQQAVPKLIAETGHEARYIAQLEVDLANAANWLEIDDVIQALQGRGYWQGKRLRRLGGGNRQGPLRIASRDGYVIWVGRNSRQNEQLTFKTANSQDLWLHARDVPGAHVIIRNDGRRIKDELIAEAAAVAAWYSARRSDSRVQVDYTRVKYLRAIKGAGPGMVTYRNESTIVVQPAAEAILL